MLASGRYAGQPVDTSSRRSIEIRPRAEVQTNIRAEDTQVIADHFYHEGAFWRAIIPLDGVDQIFGQAFNFSKPKTRRGKSGRKIVYNKHGLPKRRIPILNHLQSRFTLKAGYSVELYAMETNSPDTSAHRIDDFVYSLEAVGPPGVGFNLRDALAGNFISAHRFLSTQEMVFERLVVESQHITESPPLPLRDDQKRAVLAESLLRSHRAGMSEPYYLYRFCGTNNCTSNPFQILDQVVDYSFLNRVGAALYRLPLNPRFYLRVRGMDSDPSFRKIVRDEFAAYINDPATQERKKYYVKHRSRLQRSCSEPP
jgi:hypothetical protein